MDPHLMKFNSEEGEAGDQSMHDMMMNRRAERLYRTLSERGEFAKLDKAKHNEQYRNYLLQNFDEDDPFGPF